jgi:PAS domain S-box-containing protein
MKTKPVKLRARAEAWLKKKGKPTGPKADAEPQRLLHELQVHHVELEMQNAELQEGRDRMEALLEKFTDLYDFAPVGYLSLDETSRILEVNLTGAALLGVSRTQLINRRLTASVVPANRAAFHKFLAQIFAKNGKKVCEAPLMRPDGSSFWADFHGTAAISLNGPQKWCRVVISDITALKRAEDGQRRLEALAVSNAELREEIARRRAAEESLRQSEQHLSKSLAQSDRLQEQLRQLSHQILLTQEEERREISRELHDVIAQTLTSINVRLAALAKEASGSTKGLGQNIARTQRLVEKSVDIVHKFARELRPAVLDDLGLIPALHSFMKNFTVQTGVRTRLTAFAGLEELDTARRTVLFRIAQESLMNVARHAKASRAEINIKKLPDGVCMKVKDDGKSFNVEGVLNAKGRKRLGLLGMRERLEMVGGSFGIESSPGKGTTVTAQVPFGKKSAGGGNRR